MTAEILRFLPVVPLAAIVLGAAGSASAAGDEQRGARAFGACIAAIRHCKDTYYVTDGAGETRPFWEFNLRFKTDSSASGPAPGAPVMVGQGMQGDRAQVVFSAPQEISAFIREGC